MLEFCRYLWGFGPGAYEEEYRQPSCFESSHLARLIQKSGDQKTFVKFFLVFEKLRFWERLADRLVARK